MTTEVEYWRWTESRYTNPEVDWRKATTITAGVDVGSVSSKAAILADTEILAYGLMRTGSNSPDSAQNAINRAIEGTGLTMSDIKFIVGTGYGRVNIPFAGKAITEIACHARGANFIWGPTVKTILDMGGQDCKAIHCDEKGKVTAFLMNDKCAAGTGRFLEHTAARLGVPLAEIGPRALVAATEEAISSTCTVFAESEIISLLANGVEIDPILRGLHRSLVSRLVAMIHSVGLVPPLMLSGGVALNVAIRRLLADATKQEISLPREPQLMGAYGAALSALD
jgi:bzd-type benzoyl-CoA reductase Q subunit